MINIAVQAKYKNSFKNIYLVFMGVIGALVLIYITSRYNSGLTADSISYISAARNIAEGNGILTFNDKPLIMQPPLYPIMLSILNSAFKVDPLVSAGYFNAVLFGLIVYFSGLLLVRQLKSFILVICGTTAVLTSFAILESSLQALSEPLFILLILLFIYSFEKYRSKRNYKSIIFLSIWTALACLTRYTGIVLIITGAICIVLLNNKESSRKYYHSMIFVLVAALPLGFWIIRNYLLSNTIAGHRGSSLYALNDNIQYFCTTIVSWFLPGTTIAVYIFTISISIAALIIYRIWNSEEYSAEAAKLIVPGIIFTVLYSVTILVSSTTTAYDKISDRLLSPIYINMLMILLFLADKSLLWIKKYYDHHAAAFVFGIALLILIRYQANSTIRLIEDYIQLAGGGFNSSLWQESETIHYLLHDEKIKKYSAVYSNEPEAVYIYTGSKTNRSPLKTFYNSNQPYDIKQDEEDVWLNGHNVYLVWFSKSERKFLYTVEELKNRVMMKKIAELEDGEIYLVSPKHTIALPIAGPSKNLITN